ncbi:MAG: flagellar hook-length control protein FliK [Deltaproteobacteria bacterium]|nr:flagellar hook-length control protein FliK [Deltaproteobacteria bacterium]
MTSLLVNPSDLIERGTSAASKPSYEFQDDKYFYSVLERARENREQMVKSEQSHAQTKLTEARRDYEEGLRSKKERLDAELKKARLRAREEKEALKNKQIDNDKSKSEQAASFGADGAQVIEVKRALVAVGSLSPEGFKGRVGLGLMASGKTNKAAQAFLISGTSRASGLLKKTLEDLGGLASSFTLDKKALNDLKAILEQSGVEAQEAAKISASLAGLDNITLDKVLLVVSKAEELAAGSGPGGGLTATPSGLNSLGQYLNSLGLSTEAVKAATSGLTPGQTVSSYELRMIITSAGGESVLKPALNETGDLVSLVESFKYMGADSSFLEKLSLMIDQRGSQTSLDDLLGLMAFAEKPGSPNLTNSEQAASLVQNLLKQTKREGELVKAPIFNEIVIKLTSLGDRQLNEDFSSLSPALQALRGGLSSLRDQSSGHMGGGGRERQSGNNREERLMTINGISTETVGRGLGESLFQSQLAQESFSNSNSKNIAKQIEDKLVYSARRGIHRLKMNLDPESLGRLEVELKVKDDVLTANIRAETLEAYEALEKEVAELKQSLKLAGLEARLTISFDGQESQPSASPFEQDSPKSGREGSGGNFGGGNSNSIESDFQEGPFAPTTDHRLLDALV